MQRGMRDDQPFLADLIRGWGADPSLQYGGRVCNTWVLSVNRI